MGTPNKKIILLIITFVFSLSFVEVVSAVILYVPDEYSSIQAAVDAANSGDIIIIGDGSYRENIKVSKDHLTIKSENGAEKTIVQAKNSEDSVFVVTADYVTIDGFTVEGANGKMGPLTGITIVSSNNTIKNNIIANNNIGISLTPTTDNKIYRNTIGPNKFNIGLIGICVEGGCWCPKNNKAYLNNFRDKLNGFGSEFNLWNYPEKIIYTYKGNTYTNYLGNYWEDYEGVDGDGDGLGDSPYIIESGGDNYPLMEPFETYFESTKLPIHNLDTGEDFPTIQAAIDDSNTKNGDTIIVDPGIYVENVDISKSLTIKSTSGNPEDTLVQAKDQNTDVFFVHSLWGPVKISGFTIEGAKGSWWSEPAGIHIGPSCHRCSISSNKILNNHFGVHIYGSSFNIIAHNEIDSNDFGVVLKGPSGHAAFAIPCVENNVIQNTFVSNKKVINLFDSYGNKILPNNFINNKGILPVLCPDAESSFWDSSPLKIDYIYNNIQFKNYIGNYWDDYAESDTNNDGIGDTPYYMGLLKKSLDDYPLIEPCENYKVDEQAIINFGIYNHVLIFECPINVTITDQYNRIISDNGTNEIPNASIFITNETKIFYLPINIIYSVRIDAYDAGKFKFTKVSPIENNISITKFGNISITKNTRVLVKIESNVINYTMSIDYDGDGEIDEEKIPNVNEIININQPPVALFTYSSENIIVDKEITFNASSSYDSDGLIVSYRWKFGDREIENGEVVTHFYSSPANYSVILTVVDDNGIRDSVQKTVKIKKNLQPIADANGPYENYEGSSITFNGSGSYDSDGDVLQYRWDFNNDGIWDTGWSINPIVNYTWDDDYSGIVKLEINDGEFTATDIANITVKNVPPIIETILNQTVECCLDVISLNASFNDLGLLDTHTAKIDWGDGTIDEGTIEEGNGMDNIKGNHKYCIANNYTVAIFIIDDDGGIGIGNSTVTVIDTCPPEVNIISPKEIIYLNKQEPVLINYAVSDICDLNPKVKLYLDEEVYTEYSIDLGKYLGETKHILRVVATDKSGNVKEDMATFKVVPKSMESFLIKKIKIVYSSKHSKDNTKFTILGSFELPEDYQKKDINKSAFLYFKIADKEGKDKVTFKEFRNFWFYHEPWKWKIKVDDSLNTGIDIKRAFIYWLPYEKSKEKFKKNWFYIEGELSLEGIDINTLPREATISLEIPVKPYQKAGSLSGKEIIEFKKFNNIWFLS
ncbi:MAG: PKD domain-containing protein [Candidatus Aenigmarchaeota archaeon]|nr:PKD domain-containing protein [Candidatus Aenigmarchaeota archaeon]